MKQIIIMSAVISCLFLYGCHEGESSTSTNNISDTNTTTVAIESVTEKQSTAEITSNTVMNTTKENSSTSSKSSTTTEKVSKTDSNENAVDFSEAINTVSQTNIEPQTTNEEKQIIENSSEMTDDGLNWSPLTPVN